MASVGPNHLTTDKLSLGPTPASVRFAEIVLTNSTQRNSPQNSGTNSFQTILQKTTSEKATVGEKMFSGFGHFGPDTEFFNTISATRTLGCEISLHRSRMTAIPFAPLRSGPAAFMLHVRGPLPGRFRKGLKD